MDTYKGIVIEPLPVRADRFVTGYLANKNQIVII